MDDEFAMVFSVSKLYELGYFQGFSKYFRRCLHSILTESSFPRRDIAEVNASLKQLIPCAILRYKDLLFTYRRTGHAKENRLHNLYSIGIGGQINSKDSSKTLNSDLFHESLETAVLRKIGEEVSTKSGSESCLGLINYDSTPVGKVHFGLVDLCWLDTSEVRIREKSYITEGKLVSSSSGHSHPEEYESWSRILIESVSE